MISEEVKQKHQEILVQQRENAAANTVKSNKRAYQMKAQATERNQHQAEAYM